MANTFHIDLERELVARRRAVWRSGTAGASAGDDGTPQAGIAFSGGGIRSAIVSLGLAQALAKLDLFRRIDYLSTVSGGGYTGAFLGSLFLPRRDDLSVPDPAAAQRCADDPVAQREAGLRAAQRAQHLLSDDPQQTTAQIDAAAGPVPIVHPLHWLRENGRYLTPGGPGDAMYMAAYYLRALLGVMYVTIVALLLLAFVVYLGRLALAAVTGTSAFGWADLPDGIWWSPLAWLPLATLLLGVVPLITSYWIVYRQESRTQRTAEEWAIEASPYVLALLSVGAWVAVREILHGSPLQWLPAYGVVLGLAAVLIRNVVLSAALSSTKAEQIAWRERLARAEAAVRAYAWITESGEVARARQKLTSWLATALYVTLGLAAVAATDSLGQWVYVRWVFGYAQTGTGAAVAALAFVVWRVAGWLAAKDVKGWIAVVVRYRKPVAILLAAAALLTLSVLAAVSIQAAVWSGPWPELDPAGRFVAGRTHAWLVLGAGLLVALLFALVWLSVGFLNNSTLYRFYAARLVRTFLGAANFQRLRDMQAALANRDETAAARVFVSQSHLGDDVGLRSYYSTVSGAPLHLINANLNESVSRTSNLQREDRKGMSLSIGPAGIAVQEEFWRWRRTGSVTPMGLPGSDIGSFVLPESEVDRDSLGAESLSQCERLSLGQWAAISGAAVSTGLGALSSAGFSMLIWLVNARLGYWWRPAPAMGPSVRERMMRVLRSYGLVWQEFTGGFLGRRDVFWNLSDGGHFENSAVYELIRRRVPLIVAADNAADPKYEFPDLQNLVRRARLDFGAEIRFLDSKELDQRIKAWPVDQQSVRQHLASFADFAQGRLAGTRCALLGEIAYPLRPGQEDDAPRQRSLLLVIKPTLANFLPADVQLYGRDNADFPQQSTGDQFFDEAQWESYRKLGYEFGLRLFAAWESLALDADCLMHRADPVEVRARTASAPRSTASI